MSATKRLLAIDPTLKIHNEGEWGGTVSEYSAFNDAGLEAEVGEFMYGLIRVLKPDRVLETGTHIGVGASYMGLALQDNDKGVLDTIEFLPELHKQAVERIKKMGLEYNVNLYLQDVKDFKPQHAYKFILLDTEPQTRFAEFIKFFPHLEEGGFIFIHDLHNHMCQGNINPDHPEIKSWPFGTIPSALEELVVGGKVKPFHFTTPRGLTGFYKPHPKDYNFSKEKL